MNALTTEQIRREIFLEEKMGGRYKEHSTSAGRRIYDYVKFDYIKNDDGTYFLVDTNDKKRAGKVREKMQSLKIIVGEKNERGKKTGFVKRKHP